MQKYDFASPKIYLESSFASNETVLCPGDRQLLSGPTALGPSEPLSFWHRDTKGFERVSDR